MSSKGYDYLDDNSVAGEMTEIFAKDITAAEGHCSQCGTIKHIAEAHVYVKCPGVVARCAVCHQILFRFVCVRQRVFLDVRELKYLSLDRSLLQEYGR